MVDAFSFSHSNFSKLSQRFLGFCFDLVFWETHPVMLKDYSGLCAQNYSRQGSETRGPSGMLKIGLMSSALSAALEFQSYQLELYASDLFFVENAAHHSTA